MTDEDYDRIRANTTVFDASEYLDDPEIQAELLSEALETGDTDVIAAALGTIARARGMTQLAEEAGVARSALYAALKNGGNPTLDTVMRVLKALGVGLAAKRAA